MHAHSGTGLWALPLTLLISPAYAVDYLSVGEAQKLLFPDAGEFVESPVRLSSEQRAMIRKRAGVRQRTATQAVWRSEREGELLGWFMLDAVIGKHEYIDYAAAISPAGEVLGIEILSYRESHGGEVQEAGWREQFHGKTLHDPLKLGRDVANISGATLSCRNLLDGVRRLLVLHDLMLKDG